MFFLQKNCSIDLNARLHLIILYFQYFYKQNTKIKYAENLLYPSHFIGSHVRATYPIISASINGSEIIGIVRRTLLYRQTEIAVPVSLIFAIIEINFRISIFCPPPPPPSHRLPYPWPGYCCQWRWCDFTSMVD